MGFFTSGPAKCGVCNKTTNCKCATTKAKPEKGKSIAQVKTARGTVISHSTTKTGNTFCGKCKSRIVNGVHSGLCQ